MTRETNSDKQFEEWLSVDSTRLQCNTTNKVPQIRTANKGRTSKEKKIMPSKDSFSGDNYKGYDLAQKNQKYSRRYLDKAIDLIETMTERHSKVLTVRVDVRYPASMNSDGTNKDFQHLTENLMKDYERRGYDPQYIARREQKKSKNPHLHLGLALDGSKKRDRNSVIEDLENQWSNVLGMTVEEIRTNKLIYPCNTDPQGNARSNGYLIERPKQGDIDGLIKYQEDKDGAVKQLSYLCKREEDDMTPSRTRKIFSSQFKKDYDTAMENKRKWREKYLQKGTLE